MKIFIIAVPASGWGDDDVIGYALCEDGEVIASHLSSNTGYARHDMGLTSDWKHEKYKSHCPDGYALVDLIGVPPADLMLNVEYAAAITKNKARKAIADAEENEAVA